MKAAAVARVAALGLAGLAVVDPAVTSSRLSRPLVAVVASDATNSALTERVVDALDERFTVVEGRIAGAAATVVVGDRLPDEFTGDSTPLVALLPSVPRHPVRLVAMNAPATAPLHARVPVEVAVVAPAAPGREVLVELRAGNQVIDAQTIVVSSDTSMLRATLHTVASTAGAHPILVVARLDGAAVDSASAVIDVRDERLDVLFHDPRPSWASTFVRRAVEQDPRFSVAHRVVTSRGLSNTAGAAPLSLADSERLAAFAAIVVGAPEQLTAADLGGLERYMRRRGGRVVLLLDGESVRGAERLTGVPRWRSSRLAVTTPLSGPDGSPLIRARELAWPSDIPVGSTVHAGSVASDSSRRAVIWSVPVGAGRLVVSGALDAWHNRDVASGFDRFWTSTLSTLAAGAPGAISVDLAKASLAPGDVARVRVALRDVLLPDDDVRTGRVGAELRSNGESTRLRLWPVEMPGVFEGRIVAPRQPGPYLLVVSSGPDSAAVPLVVAPEARQPVAEEHELLAAFASSRGGFLVTEDELRTIPGRLSSAIRAMPRVETWHPMRSPWWIVPFALLLGVEWWWRRRRGLA